MKIQEYKIATEHGRIAVMEAGTGNKPILFVHGNSSCKEVFEHQFNHFSKNHRVIAFDLPGHGQSENAAIPEKTYTQPSCADIALQVLEESNANDAVVVGWSLGGHIGIEMVYKNPGLSGLVITGTPPCGPGEDSVNAAFTPLPHMAFTSKEVFTQEDAELYGKYTLSLNKPLDENLVATVKRTDGKARHVLWNHWTALNQGCPQIVVLENWHKPVAVIQGDEEAFFDNTYFDKINFKNLWNNKIHTIPKAGHAPFWEYPAQYNELLEGFLSDC